MQISTFSKIDREMFFIDYLSFQCQRNRRIFNYGHSPDILRLSVNNTELSLFRQQ